MGLANKVVAQGPDGAPADPLRGDRPDLPGGSYIGPSGSETPAPPVPGRARRWPRTTARCRRLWDPAVELTA